MRVRFFLLCTALIAVHLALHVALALGPAAPDLVVVALLLASRALGSAAGAAALGFALGLAEDAFAAVSFGASVFALTVVGALGARTRDFFVGDSIPFLAVFLALGKWGRDVLEWVASDPVARPPFHDLALAESPLAALYAAAAGLGVRLLFIRRPPVRRRP